MVEDALEARAEGGEAEVDAVVDAVGDAVVVEDLEGKLPERNMREKDLICSKYCLVSALQWKRRRRTRWW